MLPELNALPPHRFAPPHGPAATRLAQGVAAALPPTLVALWQASGQGTLVIHPTERPRYAPGVTLWRDSRLDGVLFLPPDAAAATRWPVLGAWLDHWAGSGGRAARLSEGQGATPTLQAAADRLAATLARGYAAAWLGTDEAPALLARALAAHHHAPRALSAADPHLARWLRATLLDEGFWRRVRLELLPPLAP